MKKLCKSENDVKINGVIGGLAEYLNIDSTILRIIVIIIFCVTGFMPVGLIYIICAFLMPECRVYGNQYFDPHN